MTRLAIPLAAAGSVGVILFISSQFGAVVCLSVAAVMSEIAGLILIAKWLKVDIQALLTGRKVITVGLAGSLAFGGRLRAKKIPEAFEEAIKRLDGEIDEIHDNRDARDWAIREEIAKTRATLRSTIAEETKDPAIGLIFVVLGVVLSALANIVGA